jgi:RNA polymerase sigma-70 factor (ECF subfamily)
MVTKPEDLAALIARMGNGDRDALAPLYHATSLKLFDIVFRILRRKALAEEILQEVYVRIWEKASEFEAGRASPITWMAVIARNRAIDEVRRKIPVPTPGGPEILNVADTGASPAEQLELSEDLRRLEECLDGLETERRNAVCLAYLDGLSRQELADRFGQPVGTIKTWLHRSLKQLKSCLDA